MQFIKKLFEKSQTPIVTKEQIARGYQRAPTMTRFLPWCDYSEQHKVFLLEDNQSLAVGFTLTPVACEARPAEMLAALANAVRQALQNAIPCEKENPWILQFFVTRTRDLSQVGEQFKQYIPDEQKNNLLTIAHTQTLQEHLQWVAREEGIFFDSLVTNQIFRAGFTEVRAILYRRVRETKKNNPRRSALEEIVRISRKLTDQLRACGIKTKRLTGKDFSHWMTRWFNPKPKQTNGDVNALIEQLQFPEKDKKPFGWDLTEQLFFSAPESGEEGWLFDGLPHKVITIQSVTSEPAIGHLTAERTRGTDEKLFTLLDQLPEGSVFSFNIVFQAQSEVQLHLKTVLDSAVGRHAQAMSVKNEIANAHDAIVSGDYLLPVTMAVYLRGNNETDLHEKEAQAEVLLNSNGFKIINDDELFPVDAYLRYLPMCYDFHLDKKFCYRSRYILLSDIAKLLPIYGRSRGTEHPGIVLFNRGGEAWLIDLLKDKMKNAHLLLLGETGTGKSNFLNSLVMQTLALYNPRFFIVEAGGSFDLLADYCKELGLTVNKIKIDPRRPISLNPFANGLKVLEQIEQLDQLAQERFITKASEKLEKEKEENIQGQPDEQDDNPDPLGDMVLAALMMITGGEKKEEDRITRADRMLVMDAIILAAKTVKQNNSTQMIASDLVAAFESLANTMDIERDAEKIRRAREMADSLRYFTRDPISSQFFNTPGEPWPLSDMTVVDLGLFAQEGYEAQRSIAFAGLIAKVLALADGNQYSNRPMILLGDEIHIIVKIPLLAMMLTRVSKMGRKLGLWLWLATQNMRDFADEAHKMLAMIENWICLALPPDEVDQVERFKKLTPERRALLLSAQKEAGKFTEGVLFSSKIQGLFRNIPPRLYLALAQTEQVEKNARFKLMQQFKCTELEAAKMIAKQMMQAAVIDMTA